MAAGNKHLGYKDALNDIEVQSPGTKSEFYFGFLRSVADQFSDGLAGSGEDDADGIELGACTRCGAPSPSEVCAFCRLVERAGGVPRPVDPGAGADPHLDRGDERHRRLIGDGPARPPPGG